jgi:hypothetical protein
MWCDWPAQSKDTLLGMRRSCQAAHARELRRLVCGTAWATVDPSSDPTLPLHVPSSRQQLTRTGSRIMAAARLRATARIFSACSTGRQQQRWRQVQAGPDVCRPERGRGRPRAPRALQSWVPAAGLRVGILSDLSMNMSMHCLSSGITAGTFNLPRRKSHSAPRMGERINPNRMIYL